MKSHRQLDLLESNDFRTDKHTSMKKNYISPILITSLIVLIIIVAIFGFIGYKILGEMKQENLVIKEIDKIDNLLSQGSTSAEEELLKLLDRKVSKGHYGRLEETIKNHLKDNYLAKIQIEKSMEELSLLSSQSLDNIMEKSTDFKSYIQEVKDIKSNYENAIQNYDYVQSKSWFKDHPVDNLKGNALSMYEEYQKSYLNARSEDLIKELEADKAYLTSNLEAYLELITFLEEAKNRYEYKDDILIFNDPNPDIAHQDLQQYHSIIDKFQ